jgi:hypothetical protein
MRALDPRRSVLMAKASWKRADSALSEAAPDLEVPREARVRLLKAPLLELLPPSCRVLERRRVEEGNAA